MDETNFQAVLQIYGKNGAVICRAVQPRRTVRMQSAEHQSFIYVFCFIQYLINSFISYLLIGNRNFLDVTCKAVKDTNIFEEYLRRGKNADNLSDLLLSRSCSNENTFKQNTQALYLTAEAAAIIAVVFHIFSKQRTIRARQKFWYFASIFIAKTIILILLPWRMTFQDSLGNASIFQQGLHFVCNPFSTVLKTLVTLLSWPFTLLVGQPLKGKATLFYDDIFVADILILNQPISGDKHLLQSSRTLASGLSDFKMEISCGEFCTINSSKSWVFVACTQLINFVFLFILSQITSESGLDVRLKENNCSVEALDKHSTNDANQDFMRNKEELLNRYSDEQTNAIEKRNDEIRINDPPSENKHSLPYESKQNNEDHQTKIDSSKSVAMVLIGTPDKKLRSTIVTADEQTVSVVDSRKTEECFGNQDFQSRSAKVPHSDNLPFNGNFDFYHRKSTSPFATPTKRNTKVTGKDVESYSSSLSIYDKSDFSYKESISPSPIFTKQEKEETENYFLPNTTQDGMKQTSMGKASSEPCVEIDVPDSADIASKKSITEGAILASPLTVAASKRNEQVFDTDWKTNSVSINARSEEKDADHYKTTGNKERGISSAICSFDKNIDKLLTQLQSERSDMYLKKDLLVLVFNKLLKRTANNKEHDNICHSDNKLVTNCSCSYHSFIKSIIKMNDEGKKTRQEGENSDSDFSDDESFISGFRL